VVNVDIAGGHLPFYQMISVVAIKSDRLLGPVKVKRAGWREAQQGLEQGASEKHSGGYVTSEQRGSRPCCASPEGLPFFGSLASLLVSHVATAMLPPRASPVAQTPGNATRPFYLNRP